MLIRSAKVIFDIDSGLYEVVTNNGYANKEDAETLRVKIEELIRNE